MDTWEIVTPEATLECSLEPYCEMVIFEFVYGPNSDVYNIEVPLEAFNCEVEKPGYQINTYVPTNGKEFITIHVNLPKAQIPWGDAIRQFQKYLNPPHKNNKRITNSPAIPVVANARIFLPLFFLAKRFHFGNLAEKIKNIKLLINDCVTIISQRSELTQEDFDFSEIEHPIFQILSSNLKSIPVQLFRGIEMAPAILEILNGCQQQILEDDQIPSIVNWLYIVFPAFENSRFSHQTKDYSEQMNCIIGKLSIKSAKTAFIFWCYSTSLASNGNNNSDQLEFAMKSLEYYLPTIQLSDIYKLLYHIPIDDLKWILERVNRDANKKEIMQTICNWLDIQKDEIKCQDMFDFVAAKGLLFLDELDGGNLCRLAPYASKIHAASFNEITRQIKMNTEKYTQAINCKNRKLNHMTWESLFKIFDLRYHSNPNENRSNLINTMRISYKPIDSIFYHWIYFNRRQIDNYKVYDQYFSLPSTSVSIGHSPHRRLMLYDALTYFKSTEANEKRKSLFKGQVFDFSAALNRILNKTSSEFSQDTLYFIKRHIINSSSKMVQYCSLLEKFYIPLQSPDLVEPINEYSFSTCLRILMRSQNSLMKQKLLPMAGLMLGTLSIQELINMARNSSIKLYEISNIKEIDEDTVLLYALSQPRITDKDMKSIVWCQVSSRAITKLCGWKMFNSIKYQFDEGNVISHIKPFNDINSANAVYRDWFKDAMPRGGQQNLASLPPLCVVLFLVGYVDNNNMIDLINMIRRQLYLIGYQNANIVMLDNDTEYQLTSESVIIYKNPFCNDNPNIRNFVTTLFQHREVPITMNALMLRQIITEYNEEWNNYMNKEAPEFEFPDDDEFTKIEWKQPTPTMLPTKNELIVYNSFINNIENSENNENNTENNTTKENSEINNMSNDDNNNIINFNNIDDIYMSIGFRGNERQIWRAVIEMKINEKKQSRLFACAMPNVPLTVFNFGLGDALRCRRDENVGGFDSMVRFKHTAMCLLSLLCESISGIEPQPVKAGKQEII